MDARVILVIDPDPATRMLMSEVLEPEGYRVVTAFAESCAPDALGGRIPDLVLYGITDLTGAALSAIARLRARLPGTPLVVVTTSPDGLAWARQIDAAGFLMEPFDIEDLLTVIQRTIRPLDPIE